MTKARYTKLLLGEGMSGSGKGTCIGMRWQRERMRGRVGENRGYNEKRGSGV
jgi:hypothetical protein